MTDKRESKSIERRLEVQKKEDKREKIINERGLEPLNEVAIADFISDCWRGDLSAREAAHAICSKFGHERDADWSREIKIDEFGRLPIITCLPRGLWGKTVKVEIREVEK